MVRAGGNLTIGSTPTFPLLIAKTKCPLQEKERVVCMLIVRLVRVGIDTVCSSNHVSYRVFTRQVAPYLFLPSSWRFLMILN